jgi:hypothetical protein
VPDKTTIACSKRVFFVHLKTHKAGITAGSFVKILQTLLEYVFFSRAVNFLAVSALSGSRPLAVM